MFFHWLHRHWLGLRRALHVALCLPPLWLAAGVYSNAFGPNPLEVLMRSTGRWALYLLMSALLITPARRLAARLSSLLGARFGKRMADWNWLVRLRRMLGLWCFTYAALHFSLYFWLDVGLDARVLAEDLGEKPYLAVGLATLLILGLLAATSNDAAMRRMGRHWKSLHRLSHVAPVLALLHFWMMTKPGHLTPLPMTVLVVTLLGLRFALHLNLLPAWDGADGEESSARTTRPQPMPRSPAAKADTPASI